MSDIDKLFLILDMLRLKGHLREAAEDEEFSRLEKRQQIAGELEINGLSRSSLSLTFFRPYRSVVVKKIVR